MTTSSLHEKLAKIQGELTRITKDGYNSNQKYAFVSEASFLDKLKPLTTAVGISLTISSEMTKYTPIEKADGKFTFVAECNCALTITDSTTGENIVITSSGVAHDSGDKAIYKAMTGCSKYSLWKGFALATGDEPEADTKVDEESHIPAAPRPEGTPRRTYGKRA
jgi:ERF superfamily